MRWHLSCLVVVIFVNCVASDGALTALEKYVMEPDASYSWTRLPQHDFNATIKVNDKPMPYSCYIINMTSQTWLPGLWARGPAGSPGYQERSGQWWHVLYVIVPGTLEPSFSDFAFMYMSGGDNDGDIEDANGEDVMLAATVAVRTGAIGAVLLQIPNQKIYFLDEKPVPTGRKEDAMIAWTWQHFIEHPDEPTWLARLPMTKAGVRAMDTITAFVKKEVPSHTPSKYIVAGASKRGWTTWTVGGVASSKGVLQGPVVAIVPIVLDELDLVHNIKYQFRAYNEKWSFALADYYALNFTAQIDTPQVQLLQEIVGPLSYAQQMAVLPKMAITAAGDEFQRPDATRIWWNELEGESHLRVMENCEHSLAENVPGVLETITSFGLGVMMGKQRPQFFWNFSDTDGSVTAVLSSDNDVKPSQVRAWYADTIDGNSMRDFRLVTCPKCSSGGDPELHPVLWLPQELKPQADGLTYVATPTAPKEGWQGVFIEFFFPGPQNSIVSSTYKMSTGVSIWPNTYPGAACSGEACRGTLC